MDLATVPDPPAIIWQARKKRGSRARRNAALFVGAVILLPDGSQCRIVAFDQSGRPLCAPEDR